MSYTVHNVEQRSDEWFALRLGRLTSSHAADMLAEIKSGEAAARRNLRVKLVLERITGRVDEDGWTSKPMQRGLETEPKALAAYEAITGNFTDSCGFVTRDGVMAGASPDGVVDDFAGIVEAKCPLAATHLEYIKTGKIPTKYLSQITHLLWVTDAEWCDWISYHPDFPDHLRAKLIRIKRADVDIKSYEAKALEFLGEVDVEERLVRNLEYGNAPSGADQTKHNGDVDGDTAPDGDEIAGGAPTREDGERIGPASDTPGVPSDPKEAVHFLCERDGIDIADAKAWAVDRLSLQKFHHSGWAVIVEEWHRMVEAVRDKVAA